MQSATRLAYAGDETERSGLRRDAASARALLDELERSVGTSPLERDVSAQAGEELMRLGRAMIARAAPENDAHSTDRAQQVARQKAPPICGHCRRGAAGLAGAAAPALLLEHALAH